MATTKKSTKAPKPKKEAVVDTTPTPSSRASVKLDDTVLIDVQSNVFGHLTYRNQRTGDKVRWEEFGDIQPMAMGDLRIMRNTQRRFFENNWIFVKGVVDAGYEDVTPEDVYKALMVSQYYKGVLDPDNFNDIFVMDIDDMKIMVGRMSDGAKSNLVVAANDAIRDGILDSVKRIRMLEELLGCDLGDLE